jgi:hypothetical protein
VRFGGLLADVRHKSSQSQIHARQAKERDMRQQTVRKTSKEQRRPTAAHERALDAVLWRCRTLSNAALEQRSTAW